MIKDYDALMGMTPVVMEQTYGDKDCCIYALSVGCGIDGSDDWMRQYLSPLPPARALPAMATVLAAPRLHAMGLGVTLSGVLHGSQGLVLHAALPTEGRVTSETRITGVFDRGGGRGCLINMVRELRDAESNTHYASLPTTFICRLDQVVGAPLVEKPLAEVADDRAPDMVVQVPTSTQAAQMFALTGDQNPLHLLPDVAVKAGFPSPILHGVATYGLCAAFAEKALCQDGGIYAGHQLGAISGKFTGPVFPGETIELAIWHDAAGARIEARAPGRGKVVFADGRVVIKKGH